jgi:hypothetical protein
LPVNPLAFAQPLPICFMKKATPAAAADGTRRRQAAGVMLLGGRQFGLRELQGGRDGLAGRGLRLGRLIRRHVLSV